MAVCAALVQRRHALVAPAIPGQGRTVVGGPLTGTGVTAPIDVADALLGSGLEHDVPDTRSEADFDAALRRALDGRPLLLVGACRTCRRSRAAIGSWRLVDAGAAAGGADAVRDRLARSDYRRPGRAAGRDREGGGHGGPGWRLPPLAAGAAQLVRLVPGEGRTFDPQAAGVRFAREVAQLVNAGRIRTLLGYGDETADADPRALQQGVLNVEGEIAPGVPVSTMLPGGRRMQLVTKSGGFGSETALISVTDAAADSRNGTR